MSKDNTTLEKKINETMNLENWHSIFGVLRWNWKHYQDIIQDYSAIRAKKKPPHNRLPGVFLFSIEEFSNRYPDSLSLIEELTFFADKRTVHLFQRFGKWMINEVAFDVEDPTKDYKTVNSQLKKQFPFAWQLNILEGFAPDSEYIELRLKENSDGMIDWTFKK